jgi:hypothetical protein
MTAFRLLVPALVTCATAIVGVARPANGDASLDLKVQAVDPGHKKGDGVEVVVLLENGDPATSWLLIPTLVIGSEESERYPEPYLTLRILDPNGRELRPSPLPGSKKRVPPSICDFTYFGPGQIIGRRLDLTRPPLSFAFRERGKYTLTAVLASRAGAWLKHAKQDRACVRDLSRVFDGALESNTLTLEIE